jgi:hypothetical protein
VQGVDVLLFDIQDVGVRFYTYISSLQDYMEAAIQYNIPLVVLDRPNPNGFYVDGPVLEAALQVLYRHAARTGSIRHDLWANMQRCCWKKAGCGKKRWTRTRKTYWRPSIRPAPLIFR